MLLKKTLFMFNFFIVCDYFKVTRLDKWWAGNPQPRYHMCSALSCRGVYGSHINWKGKSWEDFGDEILASVSQNQVGIGAPEQASVVWRRNCHGTTPRLCWGWPVYSLPSTSSVRVPTTSMLCCLSLCSASPARLCHSRGCDLVLFIYRSPAPGIEPGGWWTLKKCLLKEEWTNVRQSI